MCAAQRALDEAGICAGGDSGDDAASLGFSPSDAFARPLALGSLAALPPVQGPAAGAGTPAQTPPGSAQGLGGGPHVSAVRGEGVGRSPGDQLDGGAFGEAAWDTDGLAGPGACEQAAGLQTASGERAATGAAAQAAGGAHEQRNGKPSGKRKAGAQPIPGQGAKRGRRPAGRDDGRALAPGAAGPCPVAEDARTGDPAPNDTLEALEGFASWRSERAQAAALAGLGRERLLAALCEAAGAHGLGVPFLGGPRGGMRAEVPTAPCASGMAACAHALAVRAGYKSRFVAYTSVCTLCTLSVIQTQAGVLMQCTARRALRTQRLRDRHR